MWEIIKAYALLWDPKKQKGIVKFILEDGSDHKIVVKSASELNALGNILRNEQPVHYNKHRGSIASGWELIKDEVIK
ncbi:hypothetical protein IIA28_02480 [candidate division KSB1 bacterium]|nr:hypothetical protein [candidate division KSB1 bacterium]